MSDQPPRDQRLVAVVDIDGVLADVRHRLKHLDRTPKDWEAFFAAAPEDPPLEQGLQMAHQLAEVYDVVYLSGRPERCRKDTLEWFRHHDLPQGDLVLRRSDDRRPARMVKVQHLRRLSRTREVAVVVDDDPDVLAAVQAAGFDVLPATWMGAEPTLHEAQEDEGRT